MADRRALQRLHQNGLHRRHMFAHRRGSFFLHYMPANSLVNQRYRWIPPAQELIDGHLCLNDQSVFQIPREDEAENHHPPPPVEERSTWRSTILELDGDYTPTPNDGFSEETISDHLQTRAHHVSENQETDICVVCQSEYEENENLGRLRCGHEYHADCIARWLLLRKFCPVCKRIA